MHSVESLKRPALPGPAGVGCVSVSKCVSIYVCVYLCVSTCVSVYMSVVCICACVCIRVCVPLYLCIFVSMCPCICVCVGASSPPTPTLLGELRPKQDTCYGSQRRGREGWLYVCLDGRVHSLEIQRPQCPALFPQTTIQTGLQVPWVPAGPTGTRESYSFERFQGLQGFCYSKCGRRVSLAFLGNRESQAPA